MARRIENECAYCAEVAEAERVVVGQDWKVYCSDACARAGELISTKEWDQLMKFAIPSRDYLAPDQNL